MIRNKLIIGLVGLFISLAFTGITKAQDDSERKI